ncbi:WxL domain-containing protein [Yinghuangia sp. YIM S09857]|uniref:WxL domain-containing protein n=1 Tax=Yinghuangia sp. YIM S09857 TaxID=3436929 RepID=UPI003F53522F
MELRRLFPRRTVAALATGTLALGGLAVLTAPSASAGTITSTVTCVLPAGQGTFTGPQEITLTLDKTTVEPNGSITGSVTLGPSPAISPVPMTIYATPRMKLEMRGAATGSVTVTGPETMMEVKQGESPPLPPYSGSFSIPANATPGGKIEFTVVEMVTDARFGPGQDPAFPTVCTAGAGSEQTLAEVTVSGGAPADPVLTGPSAPVTVGLPATLSGTGFAPNATPSVSLCDADGSNCLAERFSANTLAIDASGVLSGTATLAPTLTPGNYVVKVSDGAKSATAPLTAQAAAVRVAQINPTNGPVGTDVTVTGTGFTPGKFVYVVGADESGIGGPGVKTATVAPDGTFSLTVTIMQASVTQIRVREGVPSSSPTLFVPFTVTTGPAPGTQGVNVAFTPGSLSMTQAGTGIDFGTATLNGQAQRLTAPLNQVTVTDSRGGNAGWSLTGMMTDLTAANGTDKIPAGNMSWAPSCAALPGALSAVTSGSAGPLASSATLCSQAADTKATGGRFTADAQITLTTPEFAAAGAYTGTLTLTLI